MPGVVYVVDDDASFRTAIERRLKNAGYEVVAYPSAQRLLDNLPDESRPSCILLDVQIPGLSGPDLQARLSDLDSTLPIVFLTGHGDIPTTVQTIKAGAQDFLTKPVSSDQLLGAVERALANHQTVRDRRAGRAHQGAAAPPRRSAGNDPAGRQRLVGYDRPRGRGRRSLCRRDARPPRSSS